MAIPHKNWFLLICLPREKRNLFSFVGLKRFVICMKVVVCVASVLLPIEVRRLPQEATTLRQYEQ